MALKEPFMVKTTQPAVDDGSTVLTADTGQSILIKQIAVGPQVDNEFDEALIGRLSVGYFRNGGVAGDNHLQHCNESLAFANLHDYLVEKGIMRPYPLAEGETFTLKHVTPARSYWGRIVYEIHDAGDITKDMPNGTEATEFDFIHYGTNNAEITAGTYGDIDLSLNPKEYPSFPFGVDMPANKEIDVHGILLKSWGGRVDDTAANMRFLRLSKDREVLFDEDREGIYSCQGMGYFTLHTNQTARPFIPFPTPITFRPGEELKIEMSASAATAITAKDIVLALVETVRTLA